VFDNRVTVPVNQVNPAILSTCYRCGTATARMINCASPTCNNHITLCENCGDDHAGTCSDDCKEDPQLRSYDGTGYYGKKTQGYSPIQGYKSRQGQQAGVLLNDE
jgi:UPF0176 protein